MPTDGRQVRPYVGEGAAGVLYDLETPWKLPEDLQSPSPSAGSKGVGVEQLEVGLDELVADILS